MVMSMAEVARRCSREATQQPRQRTPVDKVQRLQDRLGDAAKRHPERRFHALYDRIARRDVLAEAWKRVRRNKGAAGVDAETIADVEAHGVDRFLSELQSVLRFGKYRPQAVLRRYIPKADGRKRPLGIPTVRDRVVRAATEAVLGADLRSGLQGLLVRVSTRPLGNQGGGGALATWKARAAEEPRARCGHPRLLRLDRS